MSALFALAVGAASSFGVACGPPFTSGTGGAGGSGGGTPAECVPSQNPDPVGDECGIFVGGELALDENPGTKVLPVATLARAIEIASATRRIYACAKEFTEAIVVPADTEVYGGLDCVTFAHVVDQKTTIAPAADQVPVTLLGGPGARLEGIIAVAADATVPGGSSIAVLAQENAVATLVGSELRAGAGAVGAAGVSDPNTAAPGAEGNPGLPGCESADLVEGAPDKPNPMCSASVGGPGGPSIASQGYAGGVGLPDDVPGGAGETGAVMCTDGTDGPAGEDGLAGAGAQGIGSISDTGYVGVAGNPGMIPGTPGKGGGGGGGSSGLLNCPDITHAGPSGGSGASGGCGGAVGEGGSPGGSSMGLLSHRAQITLDKILIVTSTGGAGGVGANGQRGGFGGIVGGDPGGTGACSGGKGGNGGRGGSGGGGLGGHSIAIGFMGTAPMSTDVAHQGGIPGEGGVGGDADMTAKGADGRACRTLDFEVPESCSP